MKLVKALVLILSLTIISCQTEDEKMVKYLTGNWETVYVKLEMPTYQKQDTLIEYDIDFANPHDKRAIQQGKSYTTFNADGTFRSWTVKNNRSTGQESAGKWRATKDSLFYDFEQRSKTVTISFGLELIEDGFSMTALQDRDGDKEIDDTFYLETVRLPDTKKE